MDGNLLNMCDLFIEDAQKTAHLHSEKMFWQRLATKHDIVLVGGVRTEPAPGFVKRKIDEVFFVQACGAFDILFGEWRMDAKTTLRYELVRRAGLTRRDVDVVRN